MLPHNDLIASDTVISIINQNNANKKNVSKNTINNETSNVPVKIADKIANGTTADINNVTNKIIDNQNDHQDVPAVNLYRAIVEASPVPMVVLDKHGHSVVANQAFVALLREVDNSTHDNSTRFTSSVITSDVIQNTALEHWSKALATVAYGDINAFWEASEGARACHWSVAGSHWSVTLTRLQVQAADASSPNTVNQNTVNQNTAAPNTLQQDIHQDSLQTPNMTPTTTYLLMSVTAVHHPNELSQQHAFHEAAFAASPYEVWWLDAQGCVLDVHVPATGITPLLAADTPKKPIGDHLKPKTARVLREWLAQVRASGQSQRFELDVSSLSTKRVYKLHMVPLAAGDVVVYVADISLQQQQVAELQASHDKLQAFYEATPDMVLRVNRQGMYLDAHIPEHFVSLYNDYDNLRGLHMAQVLEPSLANPSLQYLDVALRSGKVQTFSYSVLVGGSLRYREARIAPLDSEEALWFVRDVSDQKRAEQQLEQSERLFRSFFEDSPTPYMIILYDPLSQRPSGAMVNQAFEEFLGYKQRDIDMLNIDYFLQVISHSEDYALEQRVADGLKRRDLMSYRLVKRNYRADGDTVWSDFTNITFNNDHGQPLRTFCVFQEITDRIEAEDQLRESREQLELALDAASLIVWNWHVTDNRFVARGWLPYNKDLDSPLTIDSLAALQRRIHPADQGRFQAQMDACLAGKRFGFEVVFRLNSTLSEHANEHTPWRWVLSVGSGSDHDDHGRPGQLSGVLQDIHHRKLTELRLEETLTELEHALAEKNILLAEVHHRVKNNMQVLGSLLSLQGREIKDVAAKEAIRASQARVRAMAAVHEVMYHNDRFSDLNVKTYIEKVSFVMQRALSAKDIKLIFNLQDVNITIQEAIPCGLVFNELLSNALKHAFPDVLPEARSAAATVTVTLEATHTPPELTLDSLIDSDEMIHYTGTLSANIASAGQSWVRLCVADNGVGMATDTPSNFGTFLMETLVEQLQGVLELRSRPEQGTRWCLMFPNQHPQPQQYLHDNPARPKR